MILEVVLYFFLGSIVVALFFIFAKLCEISCCLLAIRRKADLMYGIIDALNKVGKCFKNCEVIFFENDEDWMGGE